MLGSVVFLACLGFYGLRHRLVPVRTSVRSPGAIRDIVGNGSSPVVGSYRPAGQDLLEQISDRVVPMRCSLWGLVCA